MLAYKVRKPGVRSLLRAKAEVETVVNLTPSENDPRQYTPSVPIKVGMKVTVNGEPASDGEYALETGAKITVVDQIITVIVEPKIQQ
jgi:hypothetical protein